MDIGIARLTVYFEAPFWVGVFEREWQGCLEACKVTFGAEPRDQEVWDLVLNGFRALVFSPPVAAGRALRTENPKRARRRAAGELSRCGTGTKAQQAIQLQHEQGKSARKDLRRARDEAEEEQRFRLRQEKKKEKHRGR